VVGPLLMPMVVGVILQDAGLITLELHRPKPPRASEDGVRLLERRASQISLTILTLRSSTDCTASDGAKGFLSLIGLADMEPTAPPGRPRCLLANSFP
jgi:hypothetical protein